MALKNLNEFFKKQTDGILQISNDGGSSSASKTADVIIKPLADS